MANLVSPGVSVTVTDESFFIPTSATTTPLFFIATADEKKQPNGVSNAAGTFEHDVIRTVTSIKQSTELYGIPRFLEDSAGAPLHGDSRNEYGLFALNQFLGIGDRAYVIRANVNLDDSLPTLRAMWDRKMQESAYVLENLINTWLYEYNLTNGYTPTNPLYKVTVTKQQLLSLTDSATTNIWSSFAFKNSKQSFTNDTSSSPLDVFANGYGQNPTGLYIGFTGEANEWIANGVGSVIPTEWTAQEAANMLLACGDNFKYTIPFYSQTSLGSNDGARRVAIVQALQAAINSNTDIRSESYDYNLIVCPGYHETIDELLALNADIGEEAFVIADTPLDKSAEDVVAWGSTTQRRTSVNVAYYYPHGLASNLDGKSVVCAASGIALRTYAYSDSVSELWFAPAGTRRGLVTGVSDIGYVSGTLGSVTEFTPLALNKGQRDNLYKYFTNINPIAFFPERGILVFGQKTSAPDASALDRVNVVRLVNYIKRQMRKNSMSFLFEPNDQLTRDNIKAMADGFLGELIVKRGLYDFATLCNSTNNTPVVIDRNELVLDIALKPVKAVEFIYIPIRVVATSAEI